MRALVVIALLLALLILLGMSFLRINNLEHDVSVLKQAVARLDRGEMPASPAPAVPPTAPAPTPAPLPSAVARTPAAAASTPPPSAFEAVPPGFLDDGAEVQTIALPGGARLQSARVTILSIEGEGAGERMLPDPISFALVAGAPQEVRGICQGPETAAWTFALEDATLKITSRDCEYPVRGLRPRLRISAGPQVLP